MFPFSDGQTEEKFFRLTPEETKGEAEARAFLRVRLEASDGNLALSDDACHGAIVLLEDMGIPRADARERVDAAAKDVLRQIAEHGADKDFDPVAAARRDLADHAHSPSLLAPLYDESLVDADGFIVKPGDAPEKYREYSIKPSDEDAYIRMRHEIRDQLYRNLSDRFDYVVLDGEAKLAIRPAPGQSVRLMKEATLGKLYVNRAASYEGIGTDEKPKTKALKPSEVFPFSRDRPTFFETCFEPSPSKAQIASDSGLYNL